MPAPEDHYAAREHGHEGAGRAERDRDGRDEHQQQPDRRRDRDHELVGEPRVGAEPREVDAGDLVDGHVGMGAGRTESDPRDTAARDHDQRHRGREDHGRVGRGGAGGQTGGQENGADEDRRQQQGPALPQPEGGEPRDHGSPTRRGDRRTDG